MKLQAIDESNRSAHYYLAPDDKCFFLHEFTARKGYAHSPGNQFIFNFKKSPAKQGELQYQHKLRAIQDAISWYRAIFDQVVGSYTNCTYVPIPPSKKPDHPEYDDRMWRVVQGICQGKGADGRELILQTDSYDAAHLAGEGLTRIKPDELRALYNVSDAPPKLNIFLFDDVLSAGCHFKAAKEAILDRYPTSNVYGFFLARRVLSNPFEDLSMDGL